MSIVARWQLYLVVVPFSVLSVLFGEILIKQHAEGKYMVTNILSGLVNIVLYVTLIPLFGVLGAVVASLSYYITHAVFRYVLAYRSISLSQAGHD